MCTDLVQQMMGIATESMLQARYPLSNRTISMVNEMFRVIKENVEIGLEKFKNTPDLYMHLKTKISSLSLHIGLPQSVRDETYLKALYRMLIVQKANLFDSYRNGVNFLKKVEENRLRQPQPEDYIIQHAISTPPIVSYSPSTGLIIVPRVLLMAPMFESGFPK